MSLHRVNAAQWQTVKPADHTFWQRVAARTQGVITPANIISTTGALLVIWGLYAVTHDLIGQGVAAIFVGRGFDVLDGYIAALTRTMSPLGEALDASLDKILLGLTLVILLHSDVLPAIVMGVMATHTVYNSGIGITAWLKKIRLHTSRIGKYATAAEWMSVGFYLFALLSRDSGQSFDTALFVAGGMSFAVYVGLASLSSLTYTRDFRQALDV